MGGKNARNNFSRIKPIERAKNVGKKLSQKSAKKLFLYTQEYRVQKMGGKTRETIFPETQQIVLAKNVRKKRRKKVRKNVFYNHTNIVT